MSGSALGRELVPGRVIREMEIAERHGAAIEVARGLVLRLIDLEGQQVGDFVCFNRDDLLERYSPQNTVFFNRSIYPGIGAALVSDRGHPMMRLVADTVGAHDLICGSCNLMQWPVQPDGSVRPMAAPSHAGDYIDLLAEMDVVAANSACPSDITPTNAHRPTPMRFVLYEPDPGAVRAPR